MADDRGAFRTGVGTGAGVVVGVLGVIAGIYTAAGVIEDAWHTLACRRGHHDNTLWGGSVTQPATHFRCRWCHTKTPIVDVPEEADSAR